MYEATYKQKKVIKLAPDAVVLIEGKQNIIICQKCGGSMKISDHITSITTNLSTAGTIGTASFTISMPRHGHNGKYLVRGGRVYGINLMDEIEIYIKARFPNSDGTYSYYKSFWGVIVGIDERYSPGTQEVTISCESMMKWLQLMKTNEHPSLQVFSNTSMKQDVGATLYAGKTYANKNPYEIVYQMMTITYQNIVIPDALDTERTDKSVTFIDDEGKQVAKDVKIPLINPKDVEVNLAWEKKFNNMKSSLILYGVTKDKIVKMVETNEKTKGDRSLAASKNPNTPIKISYDHTALMDFRPFNKPDEKQDIDVIKNNYKSNLTIIEEIKMFTGFEFYLDTTGNFVFKPPFWNLDVKQNPVYVIDDTEILNWSWSESEAEVVTRVEVTGSLFQQVNMDSYFTPRAVYTNYAWAKQFGIKVESLTMRFFTSPRMCYYHAISELDRYNAGRYKGTVTIVGRPELRLGVPVFIKSRDCYAYIENISHNFVFGGPFNTTLSLSAIRRRYQGEASASLGEVQDATSDDGIAEDGKNYGESFFILDKTKISSEEIGYQKKVDEKNKQDIADKVKERKNKKESTAPGTPGTISDQKAGEDFEKEVTTGGPLRTNRSGQYSRYPASSPRAKAIIAQFKAAKASKDSNAYLDVLEEAIPVTDSHGYDLVGIFENGKSLYLDAYNTLIPKSGATKATQQATKAAENTPAGNQTNKKDDSAVLQDIPVDSGIPGFLKFRAAMLTDIAPLEGKDSSKCTCHHPNLRGVITKPIDISKKTIQDVVNRGNINSKNAPIGKKV